jgi:hypothetical protein
MLPLVTSATNQTIREREGAKWVVREGVGAGGRNEPSLVCT